MKRLVHLVLPLAIMLLGSGTARGQTPLGSGFTYQGQLKDADVPAIGAYDFIFRLYDAAGGLGVQVGGDVTVDDWPVVDGQFMVQLDFGPGVFTGDKRWLEVDVRPGASGGSYTTLSPRQELTAAPYALYALSGPGSGGGFWTLSGSDIHNNNSGNVGIGTTGPTHTLDVRESDPSIAAAVSGNHTNGWGVRGVSEGGTGVMGFGSQAGVNGWGVGENAIGVSGFASGPGTYAGYFNGRGYFGGNVGIGIPDPQASLDVISFSGQTAIRGVTSAIGIYGLHDGGGTFPGVWGDSNSTSNSATAVRGIITSTSPGANSTGVLGLNKGAGGAGIGVWGRHDGLGYGVYGSSNGVGVKGESTTAAGVIGTSSTGSGVLGQSVDHYGVEGSSTARYGVYGRSTDAAGVRGSSSNSFGVHGSSLGSYGVMGESSSTSDNAAGVTGVLSSGVTGNNSAGVRGINYSPRRMGFIRMGVYGIQVGEGGHGVYGEALGTTFDNRGVQGRTHSPGGYGVFSSGDFAASGEKRFIQPHPSDPSKEIHFVCLEGNESGTYFRGSTRLVNGRAVIVAPEEFRLVTESDGLTVQVTAKGPNAGLWVETETLHGIVVRGNGNVRFNYFVNGIRRGFADHESIRENHAYVPDTRGVPYGTQYREGHRRILIENGILNSDFTPNEETAARMGWTLNDSDLDELPGIKNGPNREGAPR